VWDRGHLLTHAANPRHLAAIDAMTATLEHRGPNEDGIWLDRGGVALGHRRLAIVDLSDASHQPILSDDEDLVTRSRARSTISNPRAIGRRRPLAGEALDQLDDITLLSRRELHEGSEKTQALDCFNGGNPELATHLRNGPGISHRAPLTENDNGVLSASSPPAAKPHATIGSAGQNRANSNRLKLCQRTTFPASPSRCSKVAHRFAATQLAGLRGPHQTRGNSR
jgi:hypothetical protein